MDVPELPTPRRAVSGDGTTLHGRRPRTLLDAGFDQVARRDLGSGRRARVCGLDGPAGPRLRARVPRGSTRRPGGTQPPGAGHGCRPAGTAGLSLRALVSVVGSAVQAGLSLRSRAAGVDQPAGRNSPSGCGAAGFEQMACLESASGPRAAWMDQPCRRDSASRRGPGGSTSRPGGTCAPGAEVAVVDQPARRDLCSGCGGCGGDQVDRRDLGSGRGGCGGRPGGPAGPRLWARGTRE